MVSVKVKVKVREVGLLTYKGLTEGVNVRLSCCGSRLVTFVVQVSIWYPSGEYEAISKTSGGLIVGGEKSVLIENSRDCVTEVELIEVITNFTIWLEVYPLQVFDRIWPVTEVQLTPAMGSAWFEDRSCDHCKLEGNWIYIYPLLRILFVGEMVTNILPVVLT
jgi:hypothetical protein